MGNNYDLLKLAFAESMGIPVEAVKDSFSYRNGDWDSLTHMKIIANIESKYDIMMDTEDIVDLSSFTRAIEILKKYGIDFKS